MINTKSSLEHYVMLLCDVRLRSQHNLMIILQKTLSTLRPFFSFRPHPFAFCSSKVNCTLSQEGQADAQRAMWSMKVIDCIKQSLLPDPKKPLKDQKSLREQCLQVQIGELSSYGMIQNQKVKKEVMDALTIGEGIELPSYLLGQKRVFHALNSRLRMVFCPYHSVTQPVFSSPQKQLNLIMAGNFGIGKTISIIFYNILSNYITHFIQTHSDDPTAKQIISDFNLKPIPKTLYYSLKDVQTPEVAMDEIRMQLPQKLSQDLKNVRDPETFFWLIIKYYRDRRLLVLVAIDQINTYFSWVNICRNYYQRFDSNSTRNKSIRNKITIEPTKAQIQKFETYMSLAKKWTPFLNTLKKIQYLSVLFNSSVNVQRDLHQYCLNNGLFTFDQAHKRFSEVKFNQAEKLLTNQGSRKQMSQIFWFCWKSQLGKRQINPKYEEYKCLEKLDKYHWPSYSNFVSMSEKISMLDKRDLEFATNQAEFGDILAAIRRQSFEQLKQRANKFEREQNESIYGKLNIFLTMLRYIDKLHPEYLHSPPAQPLDSSQDAPAHKSELSGASPEKSQTKEQPSSHKQNSQDTPYQQLKIPLNDIFQFDQPKVGGVSRNEATRLLDMQPEQFEHLLNKDFFRIVEESGKKMIVFYMPISQLLIIAWQRLTEAVQDILRDPEYKRGGVVQLDGNLIEWIIKQAIELKVTSKMTFYSASGEEFKIQGDFIKSFWRFSNHMRMPDQLFEKETETEESENEARFSKFIKAAKEKGHAIGYPISQSSGKHSLNNPNFDLLYVTGQKGEESCTIYPIDFTYGTSKAALQEKIDDMNKLWMNSESKVRKKINSKKHRVIPVIICPKALLTSKIKQREIRLFGIDDMTFTTYKAWQDTSKGKHILERLNVLARGCYDAVYEKFQLK